MKYTYVLGICAQQQRLSCMGDPFHRFAWWPNHHQSFVRQGFWHLLESKQFLHHLIMFLFEYFQVYNFVITLFVRTFPWRPATPFFLKYPLPRPPAKTWAFTTQSGVGSFFAISNASSAEWATWPSGVFTPYSFKKIKLWSFNSIYEFTLRRPNERYSWIERFLWQVLTTARRNPPNIFPNLKNVILPDGNLYLTGNESDSRKNIISLMAVSWSVCC